MFFILELACNEPTTRTHTVGTKDQTQKARLVWIEEMRKLRIIGVWIEGMKNVGKEIVVKLENRRIKNIEF